MRRTWLAILALVFLTVTAYWRVLQCDFVNYDDNDYVTGNALVQRGLTGEGVAWAFGRLHGDRTYWHPLTWVSHMLDCQLFGLKPAGHHAMNLFFHALNVALLFMVLQRMTGAFWRSAMLAALWSVHPLQVDTVAWVTERKNLLAGLFWILAMGAYARYAERPGWGRYGTVVLAMALGLLCKPVLVTLPCALLVLDFWPLRRVSWSGQAATGVILPQVNLSRALIEKLPLLGLSLASAILTLQSHHALGVRDEATGLPFLMKLANAVVAYARYLDHAVWPAGLNVLYLHPGAWPGWKVGLSALLLVVLTGLALANARRRPFMLVGWLWFLGVLVPTIGLHQAGVQAMADRFAYLPLIGVFLIAVWTASECVAALRRPGLAAGLLAAPALALLVVATTFQVGTWRNSLTLWQRAIAVNPDNYIAHNNIAVAWHAAGRIDKARHHASEAARVHPPFVPYAAPRLQLALLAAIEDKPAETQSHVADALKIQPESAGLLRMMAESEAAQQRPATAAALLSAYIQNVPADLEARARLASLISAVQPLEAVRHYQDLLQIKPDAPDMLNNLAWLRATHPDSAVRDGTEAVRLAERACELTQRAQPFFLGTLAAAYAEAGRFEDAIRAGEEARRAAVTAGQAQLAAVNERLLIYYRARRPYRQEPLN